MQIFTWLIGCKIEPAISNGHLPYPWGWHCREARVGSWKQGGGGGGW